VRTTATHGLKASRQGPAERMTGHLCG